jgi:hypothetical protein
MSLEQKIEELTTVVIALTQAINSGAISAPAAGVPPEVPKQTPKAKVEKAEKVVPKEQVEKPVDYDAMAKAFKDYIGSQGRDAAVELLATFDAKTLKDVPEAKWPLMMKAIS